ncbi:putative C6 transcription factor [Apodospora peruviana]|uniref:C6 transcription factor n=1 Tax=Apodospora peruviana TaxID=516989 RepID=A0AAE0M3U0_9PEZI|nr:putative C6 transcription factor [Apodospora peruviana]
MAETPNAGPGTGGSGSGTNADHKTRRPHRKSRYGCTKCKERRVKCDELRPRCSRCNKTNQTCQYPQRQTQPSLQSSEEDYWMDPIDPLLLQLEVSRADCGGSSPESSGHSSVLARSPLSSAFSSASCVALARHGRLLDSPLRSQAAQTLAPADFELLKHYLEHSCKDLTVDDNDQYAVQVGIPNLACQSQPLMRSVLALAAVCKCCDIINQPPGCHQDRGQVLDYLALADRYHMMSLHEIQATLPEAKHYNHVLANAAMMGMYGSASHWTRVWLAKTATFADQQLSNYDFMPKHSQWISLFRAVRLAYAGILNNTPRADIMPQLGPAPLPLDPMIGSAHHGQYEYNMKVSPRAEQPRSPINHPLSPILAATVGSALARLRETAGEIAFVQVSNELELGGHDDLRTPTAPHSSPEIQACFAALTIFESIVTETFPANDAGPSAPGNGHLAFEIDIEPVGPLSEVSPWLRKYTSGITSMVPSRLPRRTIMAFIHKAPTLYLNLIEEMLSIIPTDESSADEMAWASPPPMVPEPSMAHQLAMEIFSHWMVLVLLLDNVWWIGGIGAWELRRVVSFRKRVRWRMAVWHKNDDWWPESMFEVSRQFDKHRTKG